MIKPHFRRYLPLALLALGLVLSPMTGLSADEAAPHKDTSILETILEGGPLIMAIWVAIIGTSITMVTLIIQNIMQLRKDKLAPLPLVNSLNQLISAGNYQEAWETCNANKNYLANVLRAGLSRIGRGKEAVEDALAEHGLREATLLRTRNSYLSVIGVVSPMIGLLGTVIGMMGAFSVLASSGITDPRALSGKIGEVLLATASGLFIAIPAFVSYYIFRNVAQMCIVHADDVVNSLMIDLPYEELQGVQIGENFNAGAGAQDGFTPGARKISIALATNCPVCSGTVSPGINPCPHCGATLDWAA
ncbi:MAG: MotA/TolQ/ExbB proton channel [Chthoniobacteraceae bacterium]|nr:MotA/TolQ/ExbB proton channel [Chthoniobacteraceae bacterium]MDB6174264.1 MotA/TolQ/ExbB proton channel [Chthoniobacteraceae bacterium]